MDWCYFIVIDKIENEVRFHSIKVVNSEEEKNLLGGKKFKLEIRQKETLRVMLCKEYNKGTCQFTSYHDRIMGIFPIHKWYICKVCWSNAHAKKVDKGT